jgi:hypothetical protein
MEECLRKRRGRVGIAGAVAGGRQCILASALVLRAPSGAAGGACAVWGCLDWTHMSVRTVGASMPIRVRVPGTRGGTCT